MGCIITKVHGSWDWVNTILTNLIFGPKGICLQEPNEEKPNQAKPKHRRKRIICSLRSILINAWKNWWTFGRPLKIPYRNLSHHHRRYPSQWNHQIWLILFKTLSWSKSWNHWLSSLILSKHKKPWFWKVGILQWGWLLVSLLRFQDGAINHIAWQDTNSIELPEIYNTIISNLMSQYVTLAVEPGLQRYLIPAGSSFLMGQLDDSMKTLTSHGKPPFSLPILFF